MSTLSDAAQRQFDMARAAVLGDVFGLPTLDEKHRKEIERRMAETPPTTRWDAVAAQVEIEILRRALEAACAPAVVSPDLPGNLYP